MNRKLAVLSACLSIVLAQQPPASVFRTQSPIVLFPLSVYDKSGHLVDNLAESDILIFDNNQPVSAHVDLIGTYQTKIALVVVIQTSGISQSALLKIVKTGSLIDGYITGEGGEVAIIGVDDGVRLLQPFTSDGIQIRDTFRHLKPSSNALESRTLDGVKEALSILSKRPAQDRRLIVTISESRDRGSKASYADVLLSAQQSNVSIYTISYAAYLTPFTTKASEYVPPDSGGILLAITETARLAKRNISEALAADTGGRHLSFTTLKALENDIVEVGKEVHHQYLVSLTPATDSHPAFHAIGVKINDHPKATIRTRPGYWSLPAN